MKAKATAWEDLKAAGTRACKGLTIRQLLDRTILLDKLYRAYLDAKDVRAQRRCWRRYEVAVRGRHLRVVK